MIEEQHAGRAWARRADGRSVRRSNLAVVLRHVAEHGPRSRATIAAETGLNKSTVSSLVADLIDRRLLEERGPEENRGGVGRPGRVVALDGSGAVALGVEINVDHLAVCAVDLSGRVRARLRLEAGHRGAGPEAALDRIVPLVRDVVAELEAAGVRPVGVTLALPGFVDVDRAVLRFAPNLGWTDVPVAELFAARLGRPDLPVHVDNEANLAALGELWEGAGRGRRDFVAVSGEVGVGAGVVMAGELFRGGAGFAGELGHVTIEPDGRPCACGGRGCLETLVGRRALLARAGVEAGDGNGDAAAAHVVERAAAGDRDALEAVAEVGRVLGIGLASLTNLLNPQAIILGGYFAALGPWLRGPIATELAARAAATRIEPVDIVVSSLGVDAAMRGAAAAVLRAVLADPLAVLAS